MKFLSEKSNNFSYKKLYLNSLYHIRYKVEFIRKINFTNFPQKAVQNPDYSDRPYYPRPGYPNTPVFYLCVLISTSVDTKETGSYCALAIVKFTQSKNNGTFVLLHDFDSRTQALQVLIIKLSFSWELTDWKAYT